jgi:hypothetical protein
MLEPIPTPMRSFQELSKLVCYRSRAAPEFAAPRGPPRHSATALFRVDNQTADA